MEDQKLSALSRNTSNRLRAILVLLILLCTPPAFAKDKLVRAHWIQWDHRTHLKKRLPLETAKAYAKSIEKWCKVYKVDPDWITAICTRESHWDTLAVDHCSTPGAGIPQVQVDTAQMVVNSWGNGKNFIVTADSLNDYPGLAIRIACCHFRHLMRHYKGDTILAIRAYHSGEGRVKAEGGLQGMKYFKDVLRQYELYKMN